ncbi:MAG: DUF5117 domain-containing protein, partial [Acidobacteriota bacterium]|nr:DUF5117 domain-containing protein [Acidobacteriota bacterium]
MRRHTKMLMWSMVVVFTAVFMVAAGTESQHQNSQAIVTPQNPIWVNGAEQGRGQRGGRGSDAANQESEGPKAYEEVITTEAITDEGIFNVHRVGDDVYYEIPLTELEKDFLWVGRIKRTTLGAGYGGQRTFDRVIRWELRDDKVLLKLISYDVVADPDTPVAQAVADSNNPAIAEIFDVETYNLDGDPVIEITNLFVTEMSELSVRSRLGARGFANDRSFIEKFVAYPENINVEVSQTYTKPTEASGGGGGRGGRAARGMSGNSATVVVSYSMVKLPEEPMMPRLFDERVGYFSDSYIDYSRPEHRATTRKFITRWRLEKE